MIIKKRLVSCLMAFSLFVSSVIAVPTAGRMAEAATSKKADSDGNVVIVLDPGHGGSDSGTSQRNADGSKILDEEGKDIGIKEKDVNLKIATYCKKQLEKYDGVTIYMTRSDDTYISLDGRTDLARDVNADAFISFHINAGTNYDKDGDGEYETIPNGAEVYYPNTSGDDPTINTRGKNLANFILSKLVAKNPGLNNRGIKTRNLSSGADYYAVIRTSKEKGIPGIIIEHAFLSSPYDTENFMSSNSKIKALGVGDANGIVKYFGLKKKAAVPGTTTGIEAAENGTDHHIDISWDETDGATLYRVMRHTGDGDFQQIAETEDTEYTDETPKAATTYYYTVIAGNSSGWSTTYDKTGVSVTTSVDDLDYGVTTLKVKKLSDAGLRRVKVTWTKLSDAEGYRVFRKASGEKTWTTLKTIKKQASSYKDSTVEAGKKYTYRLQAYKKVSGKTVWTQTDSKGKSITTDKDTFAVTSVSDAGMGIASVEYAGISDSAVTYEIRRKTAGGSYALLGSTKDKTFTDNSAIVPGSSYIYKIRGYRTQSGKKIYTPYTAEYTYKAGKYAVSLPDEKTRVQVTSDNGLTLTWNAVPGATGYVVYKLNDSGSWKKLKTLKTNTYTDTGLAECTTYTYRVRAYLKTASGNVYSAYSDSFTGTTLYGIMGQSNVTVSQMVSYFATLGNKYPTSVYSKYGAPTIQDFCQMVYDISVANGVRAEVVFAQICLETGGLKTKKNTSTGYPTFGGDVDQDMCNFCGMGTTGGGVKGVDFGDVDWKTKYPKNKTAKSIDYENRTINPDGVRDGITAQVKHLKLYAASDISLIPNDGSDPRYASSVVGTAPFVEWLGIPDNPYSKGWATAAGYGAGLLSRISSILSR